MEMYTILNTMTAPATPLVQGLTTAMKTVINVREAKQEHVNLQQHGVEVPPTCEKKSNVLNIQYTKEIMFQLMVLV